MFGKNAYLSDNKHINHFCEIFFNPETGFSYIKEKVIKKVAIAYTFFDSEIE